MSHRAKKPEPEEERRSDFGLFKMQDRDWDGMELVGSMRWTRLDTLGEFWDPEQKPAEKKIRQDSSEEVKRRRGGIRTGLPWPKNFTDRMNAVLRIVYRWRDHGFAKLCQPYASQPQWISLTEVGLYERQLPWHEVDWPTKEDMRHDDRYYISHIHRVNQIRVRLLAGVANVPKHEWIAERAIDARFPSRESGLLRPHLADGELVLKEDGKWPILVDDEVVDEVEMRSGQKIAIEVELSRKDYLRLDERIFPSLLEQYDFVWYFAEPAARKALYTARGEHLSSEEDRRRIRLMALSDYL